MASFDYKKITFIAVAMQILAYIFALIHRSQVAFNYAAGSTNTSYGGFGLLGGILDAVESFITNMIGSVTGLPEWASAIIVAPIGIILLMYVINKA